MRFLAIISLLPLACLSCLNIVPRSKWNARLPTHVACLQRPAENVLIHHTYIPKICRSSAVCLQNMNSMQRFHQKDRNWTDIGYNFCIGGDGKIYEGRGWDVVGYPAKGYEYNSTGICFIGDYINQLPTNAMLNAAKYLIKCGIKEGHIKLHPRVLGIREVISTISPGDRLQRYINETRFGYSG